MDGRLAANRVEVVRPRTDDNRLSQSYLVSAVQRPREPLWESDTFIE